jgi:hypothetical protein
MLASWPPALLASTVDRAPLPAVAAAGAWIAPRAVNSLEYFASAIDLCRVYASLAALARRPGLAPIGQVLSLNDDGLQLDPAQRWTTWFKGGSEPGVLTLAFMANTRTGTQLRRHRARRESVAAHQPGHGNPGHPLGSQRSVHPGGAPPISRPSQTVTRLTTAPQHSPAFTRPLPAPPPDHWATGQAAA